MDYVTITTKNVSKLCRICLTSSKNSISLTQPIPKEGRNFQEDSSIHLMLETVTGNKIVLSGHLPSKICHMCLSYLKIAYEFQTQYKKSQELLQNAITLPVEEELPVEKSEECQPKLSCNSDTIQQKEQSPAVAVELIYGDSKFDLNDVVVIEEESKENVSYQGFLRNLGTEVSARFLGERERKRVHLEDSGQYDISLEPQSRRPSPNKNVAQNLNFGNLDVSRLKVTKNRAACEIVVEQISDTTTRIVGTLYECPTCQKLFKAKKDLGAHRQSKHPSILVCERCGHQCRTRAQLYHHLRMHRERTFGCNFCEKKYNTSSRLKSHLDGHKNERLHLCNQCGKSFNFQTSLKYHLEMHAGKNLVCNVCGSRHTRPNTLKRHMLTHTKERPYACRYCPKRFPSRGQQRAHEMIHSGHRPYRCKYCNKGFTKPFNLQVHGLSHPGPHQCHFCSKTFIEVKFLQMHTKRAHRDYEIIQILER